MSSSLFVAAIAAADVAVVFCFFLLLFVCLFLTVLVIRTNSQFIIF